MLEDYDVQAFVSLDDDDDDDAYAPPCLTGSPLVPRAPLDLAQWEEDEDDANDVDYVPNYSLPSRRATRMKAAGGGKKRIKKRRKRPTAPDPAAAALAAAAAVVTATAERLSAGPSPPLLPTSATSNKAASPNMEEEDDDDDDEDDEGNGSFSDDEDEEDLEQYDEEAESGESGESSFEASRSLELESVPPELRMLRMLYEACLVQLSIKGKGRVVGADRLALAQSLRMQMGEGELADEILVLQLHVVSWADLAVLAGRHGTARLKPPAAAEAGLAAELDNVPSAPAAQSALQAPAVPESSLPVAPVAAAKPTESSSSSWSQATRVDAAVRKPKPLPLPTHLIPAPIITSEAEAGAEAGAGGDAIAAAPEKKQQSPTHKFSPPKTPYSPRSAAAPEAPRFEAPKSPLESAMQKALSSSAQLASSAIAQAEARSQREREGDAYLSSAAQLSAPPKPPKPPRAASASRSLSPPKTQPKTQPQPHTQPQQRPLLQPKLQPQPKPQQAQAQVQAKTNKQPASVARATQAAQPKPFRVARRNAPLVVSLPSEHFEPPPLSDFAEKTGCILEGWLDKKSAAGLWQRRFFVLAESKTHFCVLKIYKKAVPAAWGDVPIELKSTIPVVAIESIETRTAADSLASGREFDVVVGDLRLYNLDANVDGAGTTGQPEALDGKGGGLTRDIMLRAADHASRLLWVSFLRRARDLALDAFE